MAGLFAHGNPAAPLIVSTLQRAIERAHQDAVRHQQPEPVLTSTGAAEDRTKSCAPRGEGPPWARAAVPIDPGLGFE